MGIRSLGGQPGPDGKPASVFYDVWGSSGLEAAGASGKEFKASGGTIDTSSRPGYTLHKYTSTGPDTFVVSNAGDGTKTAEIMLVAGGGGAGGSTGSGGGGGGGVLYWNSMPLTVGSFAVEVGTAGEGSPTWGGEGGDTTYNDGGTTYTAVGGGGGGAGQDDNNPTTMDGGSGGGGSVQTSGTTGPIGEGTQAPSGSFTGYGNDGGSGWHQGGAFINAGGGGGAGGVGAPSGSSNYPQPTYCNGGPGTPISITGSALYWAGGGGGGGHYTNSTAGNGGKGGGGGGSGNNNAGEGGGEALNAGSDAPGTSTTGGNGGANTGGGAGGNGGNSNPGSAADGGSGIIIIAYADG